jgi:hypothetical protein
MLCLFRHLSNAFVPPTNVHTLSHTQTHTRTHANAHTRTHTRSNEVAFSLVQIYSSTKSENLKATTASTLARLLRHNPTLVVYVVDKFGTRLFVAGLGDPNSKVRDLGVGGVSTQLCVYMRVRVCVSVCVCVCGVCV